MPKYLTSLSNIISLMDFISEVSTLYKVEPGPEFRLVASNSTAQFFGSGSINLQGKLLKDFLPSEFYKNILFPHFKKVVSTKQPCRFEHEPPFPSSDKLMDVLLTPVIEHDQCTYIWVITKHRKYQEDLEYLASHDEVTGIPNRRFFLQRLNRAFTIYQAHHTNFALMMLDCDHFKHINDTMGHDTGDKLLKQVAHRLKTCIREADFVARFGGDEFVILLENIEEDKTVIAIADRILQSFQEPWKIKDKVIKITPSIGIYMMVEGFQNVESIISCADKALYKAKLKGRNNYVFYT